MKKQYKTLNFIALLFCLALFSCNRSAEQKNALPVKEVKTSMNDSSINIGAYFEIPVTNMDRAITFYTAVLGCTFVRDTIDGNEMALFDFYENSRGITGALAKGEIYKPSLTGTLIYLRTTDIDKALKLANENGGKTLYPKTDIGENGFVAEFEDSEGNRIALSQRK
jgi:uncharacterized protein